MVPTLSTAVRGQLVGAVGRTKGTGNYPLKAGIGNITDSLTMSDICDIISLEGKENST